jgi:hypothetical protein
MKVELFGGLKIMGVSYPYSQKRLIIIPESDAEEKLLYSMYPQGVTHTAFVKTGLDLNDRIGLIIDPGKRQ